MSQETNTKREKRVPRWVAVVFLCAGAVFLLAGHMVGAGLVVVGGGLLAAGRRRPKA